MPFEARRWPNAVTIAWLVSEGMGMGVHCNKCARHVVMDPTTLHLTLETPVPSLAGGFKRHALWIKAARGETGISFTRRLVRSRSGNRIRANPQGLQLAAAATVS